jgi:DNA-binding winged helix-turn-helix (wHTH) protein/Tol biopolymer transport system component
MTTNGSSRPNRMFRFGSFELSECEGELRKNGVRIKLQEHPLRVLLELVSNSGRLVTREELQQKLWPADTFVDFDVGVNTAIRKLRQALGDEADNPRFIETLSRRGYRFVAPVSEAAAGSMTNPPPPVLTETRSSINASPAKPADLPTGDSRKRTSLSVAADLDPETVHNKLCWHWVLAGSCALALLIYGAVVTGRLANTATPLPIEKQITANPPEAPITAAVVSPDGKFVAYSDPTGVYIRHIDTGETRPLQSPKGFDAVPTSWFPDGTHLLLSAGETTQRNPSLWRVSILGGSPQKVMEDATEGAVSPDGSKIAFLRGAAVASREIWVMGNDGSNPHPAVEAASAEASGTAGRGTNKQPDKGVLLSGVAWSPDGRRLAYFRRFDVNSAGPLFVKHSLETVDANGGISKVLEASTQLLPVVCWAVDGRLLYAYREDPARERFDFGIWSLRVNQRSGEPQGRPRQLTKGAGPIGGLSVSTDGRRLILWRANASPQVFLSEIDAETRHFKTPRRLTLDESANGVTAWTPDSRAVLICSPRYGTGSLFRQAIVQAVPELLVEGHGICPARVNPQGTQILYLDGNESPVPAHPMRVMRVPLQGGSPRVVLQWPYVHDIQCARNPSKLCLVATLERSKAQFFTFDPEDGKTQELAKFDAKQYLGWSLSPDGSQLALILGGAERRVTFMAVSDKSTHEVELNQWPLAAGIDWAADSKSVFVISQSANGAPVVLGVEPNGNHRVVLEGEKAMQYWWVIPSPDGRYAALEVVTGENNVWMVENF